MPPCGTPDVRPTDLPRRAAAGGLLALALAAGHARAEEAGGGTEALAKQAQNPIADLISVPFQDNINFGVGERGRTQNVLNFQPVIPLKIGGGWNLITRTITPVIYQPSLYKGVPGVRTSDDPDFGLGDINPTAFFATSLRRDLMVGFGPTVTLPTAAAKDLGTGKWSAGPAAVAVWMPGHWVVGALVNNQWSFAGDDDRRQVDQMLIQPFVNYNLGEGWYLASSPIITADWEAKQGKNVWTVPVGGGFGRLFRVGKLPVNTSVQAFDNVESSEFGTDWTLRLQVQFLFPK